MIDNLGQFDSILHFKSGYFDKTFSVTNKNTGVAFDLTDYNGVFTVSDSAGSTALYSASTTGTGLTFSTNTFRLNDKIDIATVGKLYFELIITHKTETTKTYKILYGYFYNER